MKKFLLGLGVLSCAGLVGAAEAPISPGDFAEPTQTIIVGYEDEATCVGDGGQWTDEVCVFDAENTVTVVHTEGSWTVGVETVGGNAHSCSFEGEATATAGDTLISRQETEDFDDETGTWVPVICEVTVKFADSDTVSVSNNGKCRANCGMRATLEVQAAHRR